MYWGSTLLLLTLREGEVSCIVMMDALATPLCLAKDKTRIMIRLDLTAAVGCQLTVYIIYKYTASLWIKGMMIEGDGRVVCIGGKLTDGGICVCPYGCTASAIICALEWTLSPIQSRKEINRKESSACH